ncbi:Protein of unknown function [Bacillus cytotoxicus]|uniref:Uncharacterized protein n=1 Tax=Bacillus cytotoxicus TaxID=580165 RepID=A0AAX2CDN2_9BACI|nr:Protein of unknown function [Bacillus cytotoxicus]
MGRSFIVRNNPIGEGS